MIVVDTSVWSAVLRSSSCAAAPIFTSILQADEVLLPVPVRSELLGGARACDREPLRRALCGLPVAYPGDETWALIDRWVQHAADQGERFGVGDLLIAAIAREAGALVWSLDADFQRMERLAFVALYPAA
jgi:predicted nucleic acid-binding protein